MDLTRLDADAAAAKLAALGKLEAKELAAATKALAAPLQSLTKAGAKDVYILFSLADESPETPVVIVEESIEYPKLTPAGLDPSIMPMPADLGKTG